MSAEGQQDYDDIRVGDLVKYVPYHAHGNLKHPDCEIGKVTSISANDTIFVRFKGVTSQGCNPDQLRLLAR